MPATNGGQRGGRPRSAAGTWSWPPRTGAGAGGNAPWPASGARHAMTSSCVCHADGSDTDGEAGRGGGERTHATPDGQSQTRQRFLGAALVAPALPRLAACGWFANPEPRPLLPTQTLCPPRPSRRPPRQCRCASRRPGRSAPRPLHWRDRSRPPRPARCSRPAAGRSSRPGRSTARAAQSSTTSLTTRGAREHMSVSRRTCAPSAARRRWPRARSSSSCTISDSVRAAIPFRTLRAGPMTRRCPGVTSR